MNFAPFNNAIKLRQGLQANAYRLFCGRNEGVPGLVIDIYDPIGVFQVFEGKCLLIEPELKEIAEWCGEKLGLKSIYLKNFISDRSNTKEDTGLKSSKPFWGSESEPEIKITENGVSFWVHPYDGYSTGIFLDQRENRAFLAEHAGKRVLNCFSYTCGFSVFCASKGAETTNIDVSKRYLEWGKKNFTLNGLDLIKQRFVISDTSEYLKRLQKKGERFDLVILDPPSFGRSDSGVFSIEKDYPQLLLDAAQLVEEGGLLFFSSNFSGWDSALLKMNMLTVLNAFSPKEDKLPTVPVDFRFVETPISQVLLRL